MTDLQLGSASLAGYVIVGIVMSIVIAATDKSSGPVDQDTVFLGGIFWPVTLVIVLVVVVGRLVAPLARAFGRGWTKAVLLLNPGYEGME